MNAEEPSVVYQRLTLFSKVNRLAVGIYNSNPQNKTMTAIDLDNEELLSFLRSLGESEIRYLLVGGFAVAFHGHVRATHDLDLWIEDSTANLQTLKNILIQHGVEGLRDSRTFDLIAGFTEYSIGATGITIDLMKAMKAFGSHDFDVCYRRSVTAEYKGITFKVIARQDLLKEKLSTNRPKDQGDIEFLKS